jgi:MFS family permease
MRDALPGGASRVQEQFFGASVRRLFHRLPRASPPAVPAPRGRTGATRLNGRPNTAPAAPRTSNRRDNVTTIHPLPDAAADAGGTPHRTAALLLLCAAQFMVVLDASIVNVALPSLRADLGLTEANLQYVVSLYALTFGGFLILGGRAGDLVRTASLLRPGHARLQRRVPLCGLAPNQETLLVGRALQGLGGAMVAPAALSLLTTIFTETRERNRALGAFGAVSGVGGAVGLILGGLITDGPGWEWIFFINIPIGVAAVAAAYALLPASASQRVAGRLDLPGAVAITAGLAALIYGVTKGQELGFDDPLTIALLTAAIVLLAVFLLVERRTASPLVALRVFRSGA